MTKEALAELIVESIRRHDVPGTSGWVDEDLGLNHVTIDTKTDMLAVAQDVLEGLADG